MDQNYKPIHQQADRLFHKFQDIVDDKTDSLASSAEREVKEVVEDLEVSKSPRAIEDRIRSVQRLMEKVRGGGSRMMTPEDAAFMIHEYERLREQVRRLPNY